MSPFLKLLFDFSFIFHNWLLDIANVSNRFCTRDNGTSNPQPENLINGFSIVLFLMCTHFSSYWQCSLLVVVSCTNNTEFYLQSYWVSSNMYCKLYSLWFTENQRANTSGPKFYLYHGNLKTFKHKYFLIILQW